MSQGARFSGPRRILQLEQTVCTAWSVLRDAALRATLRTRPRVTRTSSSGSDSCFGGGKRASAIPGLLPRHRHLRDRVLFFLAILDQLARNIHGHLSDRAGEFERRSIELADRRAGIAADEDAAADAERERHRVGQRCFADELPVDVELSLACRALAGLEVGLARLLELVSQRHLAFGHVRIRRDVELLRADIIVAVVELLFFHEQRVAADIAAVANQHALGAALGNLDIRSQTMRLVKSFTA